MRLIQIFILLFAAFNARVRAHPNDWTLMRAIGTTAEECIAHPLKKYANHLPPLQDPSISIALSLNGTPIMKVCPGATYSLQVTFPTPRESLVTTSYGTFDNADQDDQCANRFTNLDPGLDPTATSSLNLPCTDQMTGLNLEISVTSATAEDDHYMQATSSFLIDPSCAMDACATGPPWNEKYPPSAPLPPPALPMPLNAPPSPSTPPPTGASCAPSGHGYACSFEPDTGVTVHWSVNTAMPINLCTTPASSTSQINSTGVDSTNIIHMAMEATTAGYIGLGFSDTGLMTNSDVVMGYVKPDGQSLVDVWFTGVDRYSMSASNSMRSSWAIKKGVSQTTDKAGSTKTMICFSRALTSTDSISGSRKLKSLDLTKDMGLIFAVGGSQMTGFGVEHVSDGSFVLNALTGDATMDGSEHKQKQYMNIHGALMTVAWVLLFPLGMLIARHRWVLRDAKLGQKHLWFYLHGGLQLSGMVLFVVGFAYAWVYLPGRGKGDPTGGSVGKAHQALGTIIMGLAGIQVLLGVFRPSPTADTRRLWNIVHHNLGRISLLAAWATIYMGVYMAHGSSTYKSSYTAWLVPVVIVMFMLVLADLVLTLYQKPYIPSEPLMAHNATFSEVEAAVHIKFSKTNKSVAEPN